LKPAVVTLIAFICDLSGFPHGIDYANTGSFGANPGVVRKRENPHEIKENGVLQFSKQAPDRLKIGYMKEVFAK